MELDLEKLEKLAKAATPGPWDYDATGGFRWVFLEKRHVFESTTDANAAYIVAACNSLLDIIKMYREADDKANNAWRILLEAQARIVEVQKRVQELEAQRDWLVNELCVGTQCDFPSQIECKYRTERGYYCPERKEKFKCWVAHAEKATKEAKC